MIPALPRPSWAAPVVAAALLVVAIGAFAAVGAAAPGDTDNDASERTIASIEFEMTNEQFAIEDVHLSGTGLPDADMDDHTYTIEEAVVTADGVSFEFQDTTYTVCAVHIVIEDVSIGFENVSFSSE